MTPLISEGRTAQVNAQQLQVPTRLFDDDLKHDYGACTCSVLNITASSQGDSCCEDKDLVGHALAWFLMHLALPHQYITAEASGLAVKQGAGSPGGLKVARQCQARALCSSTAATSRRRHQLQHKVLLCLCSPHAPGNRKMMLCVR